ncbi:MAG: O-antigen ligase family protein [Patescibacteria group bacterium]|nr:O-antigen ligase family protein [Patescibacteria group bacterium]MDD5715650.1 O-antigen ligase family protein [Patescibacteria group bacterium]
MQQVSQFIQLMSARQWGIVIGALVLACIAGVGIGSAPVLLVVGVIGLCILAGFILRDPAVGLVLVAVSLPFERLGAYELGDMTVRVSQIFFAVTAVSWVFYAFRTGQRRFAGNPALIPLVLFLACGLISIVNSENTGRSVVVLAYTVFTAALAFVIPNIVRTREQLQRIIVAIIISFVLVSSFGIFQFVGDMGGLPTTVTGLRELYTKNVLGFTRVQSTAYEPLYFANYLLIPIGLLAALFLSGKRFIRSGWLIVLFGLGVVNLILTVSRGGYLALPVVLLAVAVFYIRKLLSVPTMVTILIGGALVGWVVVQTLGSSGEPFTMEKFTGHITNAFYGASYSERINTFEQSYAAWREQPLIGIGIGGFGPYEAPHPAYMPADGWRIVNNEFLEILAEEGIVGLTLFIFFLVVLFVRSYRALRVTNDRYTRAVLVGLSAALLGILVQYQTFSTLYIMHVWFVVGLIIACQNIIFNSHAEQAPRVGSGQ